MPGDAGAAVYSSFEDVFLVPLDTFLSQTEVKGFCEKIQMKVGMGVVRIKMYFVWLSLPSWGQPIPKHLQRKCPYAYILSLLISLWLI